MWPANKEARKTRNRNIVYIYIYTFRVSSSLYQLKRPCITPLATKIYYFERMRVNRTSTEIRPSFHLNNYHRLSRPLIYPSCGTVFSTVGDQAALRFYLIFVTMFAKTVLVRIITALSSLSLSLSLSRISVRWSNPVNNENLKINLRSRQSSRARSFSSKIAVVLSGKRCASVSPSLSLSLSLSLFFFLFFCSFLWLSGTKDAYFSRVGRIS